MDGPRFPESEHPILAELPERYPRFAALREDFLLGYRYNTARAYWGDLEHVNDWCMERGLDILELSEEDLKKYLGWMRRKGYSGNTIRRRTTALHGLRRRLARSHQTPSSQEWITNPCRGQRRGSG